MNSWQSTALDDLYAEPSRNGLTRPRSVRGNGYRMINMGEIFAHERIWEIEMERVQMTEKEIASFAVKKGDLLFARQSIVLAGAGKCSVVKSAVEITTFESHIIRVRLDPKRANPDFFFYYFISPHGKQNVQSIVMQVAAAGIRGSELAKLEVPVPPLPVQRRIAAILSAYDDLIENNLRRIRILEEMARALYREWFVLFRFPGNENHPRVPSLLGPIPKGWQVKCAPEAMEISPRVTVPREGEKPFVPMGSLANGSMVIADVEVRSGNSGSKFQNGDTLFARITPCLENGKTGFVQFLPDAQATGFGSTEFIVLRSRTLTPEYVYLLARSDEFRANAIKSMSGASGRQRVQEKSFDRFLLAEPPRPLLGRFSEMVVPSFRLIQRLHLQTSNLRRTRDLLLPRLLSGNGLPMAQAEVT